MKQMLRHIVRKTEARRRTDSTRYLRRIGVITVNVLVVLAGVTHETRAGGPPPHPPITITRDADFQSCACVTSGSGTPSDPYVIGPWMIRAPSAGGWALKVDNARGRVTKHFQVAGITAGYDDPDPTHPLVWLVKVTNPTTVSNVIGNNDGIGVLLDSVANVSLDAISVNKMNGDGVRVNNSMDVSIVNSKLKAMKNGFYAEDSSFISIGASCTQACNDFTYDDGRGLWLRNTHDVVVRYLTTAAEDTTAMDLDGPGTYNVDIGNSTANADGSICTAAGPTGLVTDTAGGIRLVNGTHHNHIHDTTARGNIMDIASGGDGYWTNPCTGEKVPISPPTAPMGSGNVFGPNLCYGVTNIPGLPSPICK